MQYKFDFTKIKARERRQFGADMQAVDAADNGDELLIKWIARTGVNLPTKFDWSNPGAVLDNMDFVEFTEVVKAFTSSFQRILGDGKQTD